MTPEEIKAYQDKFESVQCQINEVIRSEIQMILSKLTFNRVLVN